MKFGQWRHRNKCPLEMVQCEYHNVGCKSKMCRKDLKQHNRLKVEEHLALNTLKLNNLERLVYRLVVNEISGTSEDDEHWSMQLHSLATITAASGDQVCPVIVEMPGFAAVKKMKSDGLASPSLRTTKDTGCAYVSIQMTLKMIMTLVMMGVMMMIVVVAAARICQSCSF